MSTEEKIAEFQNVLKAEREAAELTGAQLGKITGLTRQSIWNLEHNKTKMTKAQYIAFQAVLRYMLGKGADMEWLSTIIDE